MSDGAAGRGAGAWRRVPAAAASAAVVVLLFLLRDASFLLFHSVVEIFSIVIAAGVFMVAWNSRKVLDNNYLLLIGVGLAFVAVVDVLHTLAYHGMGVFDGDTTNLATQLWITARSLQAITFLAAPFFLGRRMRPRCALSAYGLLTGLALLSIFTWKIFPACFVPGQGLTAFKQVSELVISAALVGAALLLYLKRRHFEPVVHFLLQASLLLNIAAEIAFTLYTEPYALANVVGHVFKVFSFYLIYRAIIVTGLERPVDLLFRNLKASEERLERANQELEGYARAVSHDMRGPLSSIKLASRMLGDLAAEVEAPPERGGEMEEYIDSIARSTDNAFDLVEDLLTLAQAGQKPESVERVDIYELVRGIIDERRVELEAKKARVVLGNDMGVVTANRTQLYQVFSNLVSNSIQHGRPSGTVVEITHEGSSDGLDLYRVCDNGPGVPPDIGENIFDPFVKGPGGGTGIGLATVQRIVSVYGGEISFHNSGGACFVFTIPDLLVAGGD